ncbi:Imm42 family immunity protein [Nocardia sp. NPDC020380]|uniref:Imm42 family immunity protein n=1 Tax=Nocardia sp. NPDC020380 TaxID=3364309 RepID=UPI00378FA86F
MLIGDRARFAIEFECDPVARGGEPGPWMFGRIRWWCGGMAVGRYESCSAIDEIAVTVRRLLASEAARHSPELMAAPAADVARIVTDALFSDSDRSDEQIAADGARYWPFFVSPRSENFDPWDVFVVEGAAGARLIWGTAGQPEVDECALRRGEFAWVLRGFLKALGQEGR